MQKWEYLVVVCGGGNPRFNPQVERVDGQEPEQDTYLDDYLQQLGDNGWELTGIRLDVYYFKRPKNSN